MFSIFWLLFYLKPNYLFLGDVGGCSEGGEEDSLIGQHQVIPECISILFFIILCPHCCITALTASVVNLDQNLFGRIWFLSNHLDPDPTKKCQKQKRNVIN